ncbi:hypothetical protein [Pseudothauera nasutitermitis]|uniref:hypothetical protein n=1 Tax=Pseudothauera nasutitermitis TaxID=2565930 RepID=UPI001B3B20D8|nr:hypothetical protein [Pseudothauera nasutitermitis]
MEPWLPSQVAAACSTGWQPGYYAWHLENVRRLPLPQAMMAARRLYKVDFSLIDSGA